MSHFRGNEIFSAGPFVMLGIGSGWPEKLTRFFSRLLNWGTRKWKLENREDGNSGFGTSDSQKNPGTRTALLLCETQVQRPEPRIRGTNPNEATGFNAIIIKEIVKKWNERSHFDHPPCYQEVTANLEPTFEKLGSIEPLSILPIWGGGGEQTQTNPPKTSGVNSMTKKWAKQAQSAYRRRVPYCSLTRDSLSSGRFRRGGLESVIQIPNFFSARRFSLSRHSSLATSAHLGCRSAAPENYTKV